MVTLVNNGHPSLHMNMNILPKKALVSDLKMVIIAEIQMVMLQFGVSLQIQKKNGIIVYHYLKNSPHQQMKRLQLPIMMIAVLKYVQVIIAVDIEGTRIKLYQVILVKHGHPSHRISILILLNIIQRVG